MDDTKCSENEILNYFQMLTLYNVFIPVIH
jgi:hypothetical protein